MLRINPSRAAGHIGQRPDRIPLAAAPPSLPYTAACKQARQMPASSIHPVEWIELDSTKKIRALSVLEQRSA